MALSTKLDIRQSQSLVMTPQLMQAIKLLQMSNLDLSAYVEAELEKNPLLEKKEADDADAISLDIVSDDGGPEVADNRDEAVEGDWLESQLETDSATISNRMDADLGNVFPDDVSASPQESELATYKSAVSSMGDSSGTGEGYNLEAFVSEEQTLAQSLEDQMYMAIHDPAERIIGLQLINSLDENGYLFNVLEEVAEQLGVPLQRVEDVLKILQTLEPAGIFARSLAECLKLQLMERNRFDPAMEALIANIDLLARHDHTALRRLCGVDAEDLAEMIAEIKALDPKPGAVFTGISMQPLIPDVLVQQAANGAWSVELNSETLPKVLVNQTYYAKITKTARNASEKEYLTDCLQTANWLAKSLDQRAKTILKVSTEIVRQQDAFLMHGIEYLRPMNLKMIAEAIEMHESTVSRVTSNKYMSTPRGLFELKYFFSSGISATAGDDMLSAESVRHKIKQLIDAESPKSILSDDTLVKLLKKDGVDIARRTVAKYREALKIPSSVQRRREKKIYCK